MFCDDNFDAEDCSDELSGGEECEECESSEKPCFVTPRKPDPGPEAYDEFEACLNGSGLVIRVLKDTHQVESVEDGAGHFENNEPDRSPKNSNDSDSEGLNELLQRSSFARNHVKRRTGGNIINNSKLPKIRANIKYAGNEKCCPENYHVPFSKIKEFCESRNNNVDSYRKKKPNDSDDGPFMPPMHPQNNRNCCLQVDPLDIKNTLKGVNTDANKKGIEVCYKTCEDTDSDVFLIKLGSKKRGHERQNQIEIELKTPKQPIVCSVQKVTTETQIREAELDAALKGLCGKKGKKGKGKKKKK